MIFVAVRIETSSKYSVTGAICFIYFTYACLEVPKFGTGAGPTSWGCLYCLCPYRIEKRIDVFRTGLWVEDLHKEVPFINVDVRG